MSLRARASNVLLLRGDPGIIVLVQHPQSIITPLLFTTCGVPLLFTATIVILLAVTTAVSHPQVAIAIKPTPRVPQSHNP